MNSTTNNVKSSGKILIVGCGQMGISVAELLVSGGMTVYGARRNVQALPEFITPVSLDLTQPESLDVLAEHCWQAVIVTLTADTFSEQAYRSTYVDGLDHLLQALKKHQPSAEVAPLPLILFASSTSIYHQNDGSWIDETSETQPVSFSGCCMLEAERLLDSAAFPTVAIRFGGIYGAGRGGRLLNQLGDGKICPAKPKKYSNRIHIEDCAALLAYLIQRHDQNGSISSVYLAVDSEPTPIREVMEWLADQMDIDYRGLTATDSFQRGGNKRCNNKQLLDIGFQFKYPSFKQGYQVLLDSYTE